MSDIQAAVPYIAFTIIIGIFLWGQQRRLENALGKKTTTVESDKPPKLDTNFLHLRVHYVRTKGLPDTPDSSRLRYITNDKYGKASRMHELPECVAQAIKEHRIGWSAYDDEKTLRRNLTARYSIDETDPDPETLALKYINGNWVTYAPHSDLVSKLEKHNLENLQVINLTRRYFFSSVRRTLLIKYSETQKPQAWLAPPYIFELVEKEMIASENKGMRFRESCEKWCKRNGYDTTNLDRRYPESALLSEGV